MENQQKTYAVYEHVNKINGKRYIGMTSNIMRRWANSGAEYQREPAFWKAIQEFGWDGFEHNILADGLTKEDAEIGEYNAILYYESDDPSKGYNIREGAGTRSWNKDYHLVGTGKKYGKNNGRSRAVQCVETGEVYDCLRDAAYKVGLRTGSSISQVIDNPNRTAAGLHWVSI